jgi:hypothetical protein
MAIAEAYPLALQRVIAIPHRQRHVRREHINHYIVAHTLCALTTQPWKAHDLGVPPE